MGPQILRITEIATFEQIESLHDAVETSLRHFESTAPSHSPLASQIATKRRSLPVRHSTGRLETDTGAFSSYHQAGMAVA